MLADDGNRILNLLQEIGKRLPKKSDGGFADYVPAKGVVYPNMTFPNR